MDCNVIPLIKNKQGELVQSKLFKDLLIVTKDREEAKRTYYLVRTDNFKSWFGDWENNPGESSKIVDENGEPSLLYHVTRHEFTEFNMSKAIKSGDFGFHFFEKLNFAEDFAERFKKRKQTPYIMPVFLNVRNLNNGQDIGMWNTENFRDFYKIPRSEFIKQFNGIKYPNMMEVPDDTYDYFTGIMTRKKADEIDIKLRTKGYVHEETIDTKVENFAIPKELDNSIIVWSPFQIKSIFNNGQFSSENKSIAFQKETNTTSIPNEVLDSRIKDFLSKLGIETNFDGVKDSNGNTIKGVVGRARYIKNQLQGIIDIIEEKQKIDTLTEEATHFLVWMLRGTPLYNSMLSEIKDYPQYVEVLLSYDELEKDSIEFKEEVMTKIITDTIIKKYLANTKPEKVSRLQRWFNKVLEWFRDKLNLYTSDPYNKAAMKVLFGDIDGLDLRKIEDNEQAFQLDENKEASKKIENLIDESKRLKSVNYTKNGKTEKGYEYIDPNGSTELIEDTVTKWRDRQNKTSTIEKTEKMENMATLGTNGHLDIQNSINANLGTEERVSYLNNKAASAKIDIFTNNLINTYIDTEGILTAKFYTEIPIIDKTANKDKGRAGTMDLLVVKEDGSVDIYDWKFINFFIENGTSSLSQLKQKDFQTQLNEYRRILKEQYGLKVGKTRVVPINIQISNNDGFGGKTKNYHISSIEVGTIKYQEDKPYLNALPSTLERTGVESLDDIINGLQTLKAKLLLEKGFNTIQKQARDRRIYNIDNTIKELQLNESGINLLREAEYEISQLTNPDELDNEGLLYGIDLITFYKNIDFTSFHSKDNTNNINERINALVASLNAIHKNLKDKQKEKLVELANTENVDDITLEQKEIGWMEKNFMYLSEQTKPKLKLLWKLIRKAKDKTLDDYNKFIKKIEEARDKAFTIQKDFNWMIKTDRFNNKILINKFSEEANERIKELKAEYKINKARSIYEELLEHFEFDQTKFDTFVDNETKIWEKYYIDIIDEKEKKEAIKKKVNFFKQKFDIKQSGLYNKFLFIKRKDDERFYSNEYKRIQDTPELKEFYNLFTEFVKSTTEWLDIDIQGNFLPQVPIDILEQFRNSPLSISGMKDVILNGFLAKRDDTGFGQINELTGRIEYTVPVYYTEKIGELASDDLAKVLALWAVMAYNNKNMQEIETSVKLIRNALTDEKGIVSTLSGKDVKNTDGELQKALNQSGTIDAFNQYMNNALYGINNDKDSLFNTTKKVTKTDEEGNEVEIDETKTYSRNRILSSLLKFTSAKALGLNLISGFANIFGGMTNVIIEGANGRFYKKRDFINAAIKIAKGFTREQKSFIMMRYWDIMGDMEVKNRANALSTSNAERFFTLDKVYVLQKSTDSLIYNTILNAMLNNYTIKEGKIIKKSKEDVSLFNQAEIKDDELFIDGLTNINDTTEYRKFRAKVLEVGKQLVGQAPTYDILLINNSIWGRILMQFRGWIPRMIGARFKKLAYNETLEEFEEGRYRVFWDFLKTNYIATATEVLNFAGLIKKDGFNSKSFETRMKDVYNKLPIDTRNKISFDEFLDLRKRQFQASMMELQLYISLLGLILIAKPDDDDEQTYATKLLSKSMERAENEISFFYRPSSILAILKSPIPMMSFAKDLSNLTENLFGESLGEVIQDENMIKKNKPIKYFARIFPFTSEVARNIDMAIEAQQK